MVCHLHSISTEQTHSPPPLCGGAGAHESVIGGSEAERFVLFPDDGVCIDQQGSQTRGQTTVSVRAE
eukprot:1599756-Rhodomonas_salina.1